MEFWHINEHDDEMAALGYSETEVTKAKNLLNLSRGKSISSVANGAQPTSSMPPPGRFCA